MANGGSSQRFENFDDPPVYKRYEAAVLKADTLNMVIEFDSTKAQVVLDVNSPEMKEILRPKQMSSTTTRWINIWGPERQKDVIEAIASRYRFSPRLLLLMLTEHAPMPAAGSTLQDDVHAITASPRPKSFKSVENHYGDIEGHYELGKSDPPPGKLDLNYYHLVNEVWHFCSVDWGSQFRPGVQDVTSNEISQSDSPSLLFYYLFDDWSTTYSLVARKEHQYGVQLEHLVSPALFVLILLTIPQRRKMFVKPDVDLVNDLHHVGRQLAVLKRMYQSYVLIIERILERQKPVKTPIAQKLSQSSERATKIIHDVSLAREELPLSTHTYGVSLSSAATVRFERLRDRINLLALSEIQECLDEKESLVFLVCHY
ncbi:hypothetical protein MMC07_006685 [Pseudocyphellaria aurata]|nr:hypothetical protein [Pseudocyphellaria aurata]